MRSQKEIEKEYKRITVAQDLARTDTDKNNIFHIFKALSWTLNEGFGSPTNFPFDDREKFEAAWKPERRVKDRRKAPMGRRTMFDRRDST